MPTRSAPQAIAPPQSAADAVGPDVAAQTALFKVLVVTVAHFFGSSAQLFRPLTDPRDPACQI